MEKVQNDTVEYMKLPKKIVIDGQPSNPICTYLPTFKITIV